MDKRGVLMVHGCHRILISKTHLLAKRNGINVIFIIVHEVRLFTSMSVIPT